MLVKLVFWTFALLLLCCVASAISVFNELRLLVLLFLFNCTLLQLLSLAFLSLYLLAHLLIHSSLLHSLLFLTPL